MSEVYPCGGGPEWDPKEDHGMESPANGEQGLREAGEGAASGSADVGGVLDPLVTPGGSPEFTGEEDFEQDESGEVEADAEIVEAAAEDGAEPSANDPLRSA